MVEIERAHIIGVARTWLGTPYHHQCSVKGVGCDCLGLVRGVFREVYGWEPLVPMDYEPHWGEVTGKERLMEAGDQYLVKKDTAEVGDVLLIRWRNSRVAKHCLIKTGEATAIHAFNHRPVQELDITKWRRLIVASYSYPGVK